MIFAHITLPLLCSFTELFICVKPDERIINHVIRKGENTEECQVFDETLRFDCLTVLLRPFFHLRKIFEWTDRKTLFRNKLCILCFNLSTNRSLFSGFIMISSVVLCCVVRSDERKWDEERFWVCSTKIFCPTLLLKLWTLSTFESAWEGKKIKFWKSFRNCWEIYV